ncbi:vitamin B12 transporter [Persephonella hydrogeniphila]|uniref:Vitamin B12 transporter n=1 Tax=Persephonella hydrogeniphila TaxID=198703 RepID=A0A285NS88_9AQUI|nr:TonB-dependent receptor [Persephonella hydrogeniphila]SNZ11783.1 vitamin B12 transporter [Persephonella hydrogeniphila]
MKKLFLAALLTFPAFGYQIEGISVESGYGTESLLSEITSPADLITDKEIEEKHPFDIREIIFNRDGFSFSSNGGFGQTTSIYLWGTDTKYTNFMIDGIRIFDPSTIGFTPFYEHFLIEDIQQVEIVKGVQSGVWGADAVGGVINIVTKKPEEGFHVNLKGLIGDYNTKKSGIRLSYANKKLDVLLGYYWFKTSGFSAAESVKGSAEYGKRWDELGWERDPYRNETINFKMGWNITENDRFETVVKTIDAVVHYDFDAGIDAKDYDDPLGYGMGEYFYHYSQMSYKLGYTKKIGNHSFNTYFSKSQFERSYYGGYKGEYREYVLKDRYRYKVGFLSFGFSRQDFINQKSTGIYLNKRYHNNGYFITNVFTVDRFVLSQSIRHDSYSAFKDKTTFKIGGKYFIKEKLYLSANYGTGYKVPSLFQVYGNGSSIVYNPDLKPENAVQWDVGLGYKGFKASYFKYSIKDMIDFRTISFYPYRGEYYNKRGKTKIRGIDISYSRYIDSASLFVRLNYTYLDSKDPDTGKRLLRRPLNQIGFDIVWYVDKNVNTGISGSYIGKRKDRYYDYGTYSYVETSTGYYTVINAFANFQITENFLAYVKLNNLTDKYYQTVAGYATEGRSLYAGIQLKW